MQPLLPLPEPLSRFTHAEMARLRVPGVAVAVTHAGRVYADGFGVTSVEHPLPVTADTLFQIGSTSKTFTATLAVMLIDAGQLVLDAPIRTWLPDFHTASERASAVVTLRHLLTHHTGWPGDYFKDFGRGDGALARYVAAMARAPQQLPPGSAFSYCNSGFYLLARLIEVVGGAPFEQIMAERLLVPLGLSMSSYFPEVALTHRVASGHLVRHDGVAVARPWHMARCLNGGGGLISTARDQIAWARFHLGDPALADVLPVAARRRMQQPHADAGGMCDQFGLGWMLSDHAGHRLVKHGGATHGFLSAFELWVGHDFACTVLTNADAGRELRDTVAAAARRHFLGIADAEPPTVPPPREALADYAGTYRAPLATCTLAVVDDSLQIRVQDAARPGSQPPPPAPAARLSFTGPDRTVVADGAHRGERCEFLRDEDGHIVWLRWDGRLARREVQ